MCVSGVGGYVCREEGEAGRELVLDNQDRRGLQAPWPLPGLGSGEALAPCHTCFTQRLVEQAFSPVRPAQPEKQLLLVPSARGRSRVGC